MKYFTIDEMTRSSVAAKRGILNEPTEEEKKNIIALIENVLDPLREAWGAPIIVTSGFRCKKLNSAVGGSKTSQHMLGQAADIHTKSNTREDNKRLYELIKKLDLPVDQCINEYGYSWVHVSYGPKNRKMYFDIK